MTSAPDVERLASSLSKSTVSVFLFHGVARIEDFGIRNYTGKHLSDHAFVDAIRLLTNRGTPVSMDELLAHVSGVQSCPANSFVVTFDDGFWNNLTVAAPILSDFGVPATFFVTSDFIDLGSMSWVDLIEAAVATTSLASVSCPHPIEGSYGLATREERVNFMNLVRARVKADPRTDPDQFADVLVHDLLRGREPDRIEMIDRKLSWEDVRKLQSNDLFTVGGHGRTHRILGYLEPAEARLEVDYCLKRLRDMGGATAEHFSYPEGFSGSYTPQLIEALQELSVKTAVTTEPGSNALGQEAMTLRRIFVA